MLCASVVDRAAIIDLIFSDWRLTQTPYNRGGNFCSVPRTPILRLRSYDFCSELLFLSSCFPNS
jgi:hypothetical protein